MFYVLNYGELIHDIKMYNSFHPFLFPISKSHFNKKISSIMLITIIIIKQVVR